MPFSLEKQLKLLDPKLFEELCAQLVKAEFPSAWHVEGPGGDEGLDIFCGELDPVVRKQGAGVLRVWQVKSFRDGVKNPQRKKAENSLKRVLMHKPEYWTLCVPVNLDVPGVQWFQSVRHEHPIVTLDLWQADEIVKRARKDSSLLDTYFLRSQPTISHKMLTRILDRLNDFTDVHALLSLARTSTGPIAGDPTAFYNGAIPKWEDIIQGLAPPRRTAQQHQPR